MTAVESFLNEVFLSDFATFQTGAVIPADQRGRFERLPLGVKLIVLPKCIFGRSLGRGRPPYQDMRLLITLRNELVHYKMGQKAPKVVLFLTCRGLAAASVPPEREDGGILPWAARVSTAEGLRWAHNTACATVEAIINLAPSDKAWAWSSAKYNFGQISDDVARSWLLEAIQAREANMRKVAEHPSDIQGEAP